MLDCRGCNVFIWIGYGGMGGLLFEFSEVNGIDLIGCGVFFIGCDGWCWLSDELGVCYWLFLCVVFVVVCVGCICCGDKFCWVIWFWNEFIECGCVLRFFLRFYCCWIGGFCDVCVSLIFCVENWFWFWGLFCDGFDDCGLGGLFYCDINWLWMGWLENIFNGVCVSFIFCGFVFWKCCGFWKLLDVSGIEFVFFCFIFWWLGWFCVFGEEECFGGIFFEFCNGWLVVWICMVWKGEFWMFFVVCSVGWFWLILMGCCELLFGCGVVFNKNCSNEIGGVLVFVCSCGFFSWFFWILGVMVIWVVGIRELNGILVFNWECIFIFICVVSLGFVCCEFLKCCGMFNCEFCWNGCLVLLGFD